MDIIRHYSHYCRILNSHTLTLRRRRGRYYDTQPRRHVTPYGCCYGYATLVAGNDDGLHTMSEAPGVITHVVLSITLRRHITYDDMMPH